MKFTHLFCLLNLFSVFALAQSNTTQPQISSDAFSRITQSVKEFKLDTTSVPEDKITAKIIELRNLRGGFNINEAIEFKIADDRSKNEIPKDELDILESFFTKGNGKRWLDNAVIHIYRNIFTYKELKQLVKFYKTPAGQKMATEFPVIMLQSLAAGEMIKNTFQQQPMK